MDWILQQKIDQLCEENDCCVAYSKGGYHAPVTVIYVPRIKEFTLMGEEEKLEYELPIYAFDLTKPWKDLETKIVEFATACSVKDCFENG